MDIRAIGMGLAFALLWSSAFTSARMIVLDAPALLSLTARFVASGVIACGLAAMMGQSWRLSREQWKATVLFGLCQNALYLGLYFLAMQRVPASVASIVASTMPLVVALLGWVIFRRRVRPLGLIGLIAGFAGVAIIMGARISGGVDPLGVALCALGVLALAVATLTVKGASSGGNVLMIVGLQMFVGAIVLLPISAVTEDWQAIHWGPRLIWAFVYTTLAPGVLATWIWFRLVGRIGAVKAATFHFLNPFFGVAIAAVALGEKLGPTDIIGALIIAAAILAVQASRER